MILDGYKRVYVYWILMSTSQIKRYSNVDWIDNFSIQNSPNSKAVKYHYTIEKNFQKAFITFIKN